MQPTTTQTNPWVDLLITLLLPAFILMQLSDPLRLGPVCALMLPQAFPLA